MIVALVALLVVLAVELYFHGREHADHIAERARLLNLILSRTPAEFGSLQRAVEARPRAQAEPQKERPGVPTGLG